MFWLLLSRPHYIFGTIYATIEATLEAEKRFESSHFSNNRANAFKHAAWNALIAYHVQFFNKRATPALAWAKKITDMHELCFPNHPADKAMDLKNNEIGRHIYLTLFEQNQRKPKKDTLLKMIYKMEDLVFIH